jgi:hypothetical protein
MEAVMLRMGAERVIFKCLSNNDNSKQQIYLGSDFDVLRLIQHGDLVADDKTAPTNKVMYKASLDFHWISFKGENQRASWAQLILYPKYPEVRMSGVAKGCAMAPSHLLKEPTKEQRRARMDTPRCLMLGLCRDGRILAYLDHWTGPVSHEAAQLIGSGEASSIATVFHERKHPGHDSKAALLERLRQIYLMGAIRSCRLDAKGNRIEYRAQNGAGYTLESLFNITPNGRSEPDHLGWELKSHSSGPVTLMTPEPDTGSYLEDLGTFLQAYGRETNERRDFTGRHNAWQRNDRTGLTLRMEGYDQESGEIVDTSGGLLMRDDAGNIAAGWSFDKLLTHWSRKHARTAYVPYRKENHDIPYYTYGPSVHICEGAELKRFLRALNESVIYHDPGINMKWNNGRWKSKKRNQFRIVWNNVSRIYESMTEETLS